MMFASIEIFCGLANKFDRGIKVHVCLQRALSVSFSFRQFNKVIMFAVLDKACVAKDLDMEK